VDAQLVVEAVPENLASGAAAAGGGRHGAGGITSQQHLPSRSALAAVGGQFISMHFMNPVPVMKLVEVIRGLQTSPETTAE
jgi:3-hydroxyacyl-CoA dehydrogenase